MMKMLTSKDTIKKIIKCLLATALIYILLASGKLDIGKIRGLLEAGIFWLIWPVILLFINQLIVSLRLSYMINSQGGDLTVREAFKMNMIGLFFNNYLPGSLGGDITKGYYIYKDVPNGPNFTGFVLLDRFFGFLGLILIALAAQAAMFEQIRFYQKNYIRLGLIWIMIVLGICLSVILFRYIKNNRNSDRIRKRFNGSPWLEKILIVMKGLLSCVITKKQISSLILLSVAAHAASISAIFIIGAKLGEASYMVKSVFLIPVVLLAGVLPVTPGGLGWTEYCSDLTYSAFNLTQGANIFLVWRIITVIFSLNGLVFYVFKINKNKSYHRV